MESLCDSSDFSRGDAANDSCPSISFLCSACRGGSALQIPKPVEGEEEQGHIVAEAALPPSLVQLHVAASARLAP